MGYIYKITNIVNNKIYIGQTIRDIQSRWNQHINNAYNENDKNNHFHNAILKYGENSFSIAIIEECPDEILNEREKYWINYYDSYNNGYNSTLGGEGYQKYTITTEEVGKMWDSGLSMSDIAKKLSVSRTAIKSRLELYKNYSKELVLALIVFIFIIVTISIVVKRTQSVTALHNLTSYSFFHTKPLHVFRFPLQHLEIPELSHPISLPAIAASLQYRIKLFCKSY